MDPFVEREWTAQPLYNHDTGWDRRPRPVPLPPRRRRNVNPRKGPSSLMEMAARVAAANIDNFSPSYFLDMSPMVLQTLLKQLTKHPETMSLTTWKYAWTCVDMLKHTQVPMTLALQRFHQHFEKTVAPLSVYLKPLQSDVFAFISHLKIAGTCLMDSTDLVRLPDLVKNLGVLEIIGPSKNTLPFPQISDRLVRAWSLHENPFPELKVLRIHVHDTLTLQCLQYVTQFPALAMFEVRSTDVSTQSARALAKDHGWIFVWWSDARNRHVALGSAYLPKGANVNNHQSWVGLTKRVGIKSKSTFADAGVQGYETYTQLEQPVLTALQGDFALDDTHLPPSPFMSLTLGLAKQTIDPLNSARPDSQTMFFWRYWDHPSPGGPLTARFAPAENAIIRPTPRRPVPKANRDGETAKDKRKAGESGSLNLRPRKNVRVNDVGEALSLLQGDQGGNARAGGTPTGSLQQPDARLPPGE